MIKVIFPRGGGGNWLSNLIWHLETANFKLPTVNVIFDSQPQCSIPFSHGLTAVRNQSDILFSCACLFNHYLNNAVKVKYHIHRINQLAYQSQLFELSNSVKHYLTDSEYYKFYCKNIDLNSALIFQNAEQFADVLLEFLDSAKIKYTTNKDYVLASIAYYQTTCANPSKHFDNWNSMLWLGACHAITILDQLPIEVISPAADLETIAYVLQPHAEHYKQRITPLMFEWNDEYTTQ